MTLFFDLDGPILDVSEKYYRLYCDIAMEHGGKPIAKNEYWNCKRQRISESVLLQRSGIAGAHADFQLQRKARIETERYLAYDRVWPQAKAMLAAICRSHLLILVTLRHNRDSLMHELDRLKLQQYFKMILSAPSDTPAHEYSETKVRLVREAFPDGIFPGWFIGDTATDVLAGKKLGVNTVAVSFGIRTPAEFESLTPDLLVHTSGELTRWAKSLPYN